MMMNTYKIANHIAKVDSIHEEVHTLCKDYACNGTADFTVEIAQSDIEYERKKSVEEDKKAGILTRNFPDSYLETLAVYRKIAEQMLEYDTLLFHGSVVAVDGMGYLFTAKSGMGKSTHTRLWREYFGVRAVMINDDKPLLQITERGVLVHGTPWDGKHRLSNNISVPLKAICILTRNAENRIEKITKSAVYPMLLQQSYRPAKPAKMEKTLKLLDKISDNVAFYKLGCNMDVKAAEIAYNEMKG